MSTTALNPTQHAVLAHAVHHANGLVNWFPENIKGGARQKVLQGLFNRALITPLGSDFYVAAEGYDALGCARPTACSIVPDPELDPDLDAAVAQAEGSWAQGVETNESAPGEQAESGEVAIETKLQVEQADNAAGCDEPPAGTDAPTTEIDATQGQPVPASAPAEQPFTKAVRTREHSKQATIVQMLIHPQGATIAQICEATGWLPHTVRATFAGVIKKKLGLAITSNKPQGGVRTYHATI